MRGRGASLRRDRLKTWDQRPELQRRVFRRHAALRGGGGQVMLPMIADEPAFDHADDALDRLQLRGEIETGAAFLGIARIDSR